MSNRCADQLNAEIEEVLNITRLKNFEKQAQRSRFAIDICMSLTKARTADSPFGMGLNFC